MNKKWCLLLLLCLGVSNLWAKDKPSKIIGTYQMIQGNYMLGFQIFNDNAVYNPGYGLKMGYGFFLDNKLSVGFGAEYRSLGDEQHVPLSIDVTGYRKDDKNSGFMQASLGYSIAWDNSLNSLPLYDYSGGLQFSVGGGRRFFIGESSALSINVHYIHQFASVSYQVPAMESYREAMNYDMLQLSVAFHLYNFSKKPGK
jgi:hypothetical protein